MTKRISQLPVATGIQLADKVPILKNSNGQTSSSTVLELKKNPYMFSVYRAAAFTPGVAASSVVMPYDTVQYDYATMYSTSTYRITAPVAGVYHLDTQIANGNAAAGTMFIMIFKNGIEYTRGDRAANAQPAEYLNLSRDIPMAVGDYLESRIYQATPNSVEVAQTMNYFNGHLVAPV